MTRQASPVDGGLAKPRTWCAFAGKPSCEYCAGRFRRSSCPNNPKPPKGLSSAMVATLTEIGPDWEQRPVFSTWPTLDALEKRGLIEVRGASLVAETRRCVPMLAARRATQPGETEA